MSSAADAQVGGEVDSPDTVAVDDARTAADVVESVAPSPPTGSPMVVDLDDPTAADVALTGGKAAALSRAGAGGLRTLGGVVLTTVFCAEVDGGADVTGHPAVVEAFRRAGGDERSVVARSSSVVEDAAESSMAGQFASVIGIDGLDAFTAAVRTVLDSRQGAGATDQPIAVLVQPLIEPACGGVMFGIDPVTGRSDRRIVTAVQGGPEPLVSGEVDGSRAVLGPDGSVVERTPGDGPDLGRIDLRRLARLAEQVAEVFGGPQDVEWAIGTDGELWLLQSRPVTTEIRGVPQGPVYGPGPVAETFPEPLTELERDLWVPPLCEAVQEAVLLAGAATPAEVAASDVVVTIDGHVAIDLRLAGEIPPPHARRRAFNPVHGFRRTKVAWRVGRLRAAMPKLAEHLLDQVDHDLEAVPALPELSSRQLLALMHRSRTVLRALHAHEILMGMLTDTGGNLMTGASVALRVLVEARQDGLTDEEILGRSPIVLALAPPRVAPEPTLPQEASFVGLGTDGDGGNENGILREALRLRVRWIQELSGRAAWALGSRLTAAGELRSPELIRHMTLEHLEAVATKRATVVANLVSDHEHTFGAPLPASFQLSDLGKPIRVVSGTEVGSGTGAGGGVATGTVTHDADNPPRGSILVTTTLTPALGPVLPQLAGIVSETGSVLSHLAILAREGGVATVVGYAGARDELAEGTVVEVDGNSGCITVQEQPASAVPEEEGS
ncbi:MAG TPA: PEP/pyruvate-binding domain-containing protein [Acidimicrobiales bacterium]|nr:PEP/pyruvate-binding domain-containing protein [Acidimicrobiales bacterium]